MLFNGDFIGNYPSVTVNFTGGDRKESYLNNLASQPDNWYYRNKEIVYQYNSFGHRCNEIEQIDLDNYLLFAGCSHTEGVGLELEKTFPYLVSNQLGMDYYNLAVGGTGIDVITHNLIMWLHNVKKLPKALIIQWPSSERFLLTDGNELKFFNGTSDDDSILRFIDSGMEINYFNSVKNLSKKLLMTLYDCKLINVEFQSFNDDIDANLVRKDFARDLSHAGILSNQIVADEIIPRLR